MEETPALTALREKGVNPFGVRFAARLLPLFLLLAFSATGQAQFNYTVYGGTSITINAYNGSSSTVIIPDAFSGIPVTSIGVGAFMNRSSLTSVTIPSGVTSLGDYAFNNSPNLKQLYFHGNAPILGGPNVFTGDGKATVYYLAGTTGWGASLGILPVVKFPYTYTAAGGKITLTKYVGSGGVADIPATIDGLPVTGIADSAFANCATVTSLTIPASVTTIGEGAFSSCTGLTAVTIPSKVTSIGNYTFSSCTNLVSVTISGKITTIGKGAFSSCTSLADVTIPSSVTSLGLSAFSNCASLTSITIPDSVASIGDGAFSGCTLLDSAIFRGNAPVMGAGVFDAAAAGFTVYFFSGKAGFTSPTWDGYPAVPTGIYSQDFSGLVSVWDISGSYSGVVGDNIDLGFAITEVSTGKLNGIGTLNSDDGFGNVLSGSTTVTGNVASSGTLVRVTMTFVALGTGTAAVGVPVALHGVSFTETVKINGEIDGASGMLVVTGGSVSAKETDLVTGKKISKSSKFGPGAGWDLPADVTGDWGLTLNLIPSGIKYSGTGTVATSPGGSADLKATGSYAVQTDTSKITLKGTAGSLNMVISTSGTSMTVFSMKGKLYGQSLNFTGPKPPI